MQCKMSRYVEIFVPIPQKCMGMIIGTGGRNIKQLKQETNTRITTCTGDNFGRESGFTITGTATDCEEARLAIQRRIVKGDVISTIDVPKEYLGIVVGKLRKNIEKIETKSGTKIKVPSRRNAEAQGEDTIRLEIIGPPKNRVRAEWLISDRIIAHKDKMIRKGLGGDTQFICIDFKDKNETFQLELDGNSPKLDGFIQGQRYRIKTEIDDDSQSEISEETISEIKNHLSTSLENLNKLKDEKQLIADLWCHFGKVLVHNVDEEELTKNIFTPVDFDRRLMKIVSNNKDENAYWKVSFEEGVDPSVDEALPESEDDNHRFPHLKLVHTQWRYDFGFVTPSCRHVRLKAWKGLRSGPPGSDDKPPDEVKNILAQVVLHAEKDIKAWICYPSVTVLRGEIMTPNSQYDCRMKLRTGSRYVTDKDSVCLEEDAILSDYLSHCKLDQKNDNVTLCLPDEKDHEIPEDFGCTFYREAKERIFSATGDEEECFTVIVLDEKGWDSDSTDKREQEQFGIRVVMNSWSEALLSPKRDWTPKEIVDKLEKYMDFLSSLENYLFDGS